MNDNSISKLAWKHCFTLGHLHIEGGPELLNILERYDALVTKNNKLHNIMKTAKELTNNSNENTMNTLRKLINDYELNR